MARRPLRRLTALLGLLAAALATALVLAGGVLVLGRLARDVTLAMALTAVWFGVVAVGVLVLARRRRAPLAAMAAGYAVVAVAAGVLLGLPMVVDREVDEAVATAEPAVAPGRPADRGEASRTTAPARERRRNVLLAAGRLEPREHAVRGRASLVRLARGGVRLTLTGFEVDNGPDLRVHLVSGAARGQGDVGDAEDLGALKGNRGDQQYTVPADVDLDRHDTVVIWCRAFSVNFAAAQLTPARGAAAPGR